LGTPVFKQGEENDVIGIDFPNLEKKLPHKKISVKHNNSSQSGASSAGT
jgi:hypothetical protein